MARASLKTALERSPCLQQMRTMQVMQKLAMASPPPPHNKPSHSPSPSPSPSYGQSPTHPSTLPTPSPNARRSRSPNPKLTTLLLRYNPLWRRRWRLRRSGGDMPVGLSPHELVELADFN